MNDSFCPVAETSFDFLTRKHGFQVMERGRASITYATEAITVLLSHDDQRSFEVSLGLSVRGDPSSTVFSFEEILRSLGVPASEWTAGYAARTSDAAGRLLGKMAAIMNAHAAHLLAGDVDSWAGIAEQRRADCIAYAAATSLAQVTQEAAAAWASHDYQKVVTALQAVEAGLGKTDAARLAYARRAVAR